MEERTAGTSASSKDKKYVLYTVVGDDRHRTTPSTWMLRILLGSLMVVALAVVPYVSLRIAQANSRTLVVFQPVPVHNRTNNHRSIHKHDTSSIRSKTVKLMEVADLTLENYTSAGKLNETNKQNSTLLLQHSGNGTGYITDAPLSSLEVTSNNNSITVTLQESDVAIALLDDKNSTTLNGSKIRTSSKTNKLDNEEGSTDDTLLSKNETETTTIDAKNTLKVNPKLLSTSSVSSSQVAVDDSVASTKSTSSMNPTTEKPKTSSTKIQTTPNNKGTVIAEEINKSTTTLPLQKALSHKLVYVATSASGNHVGGICIWKVDKNVTNWSYFYDNIPIEFQSGHDAGDHELRASLAAVRTWSSLWQDAHVTLRSQHNAIEHSNLAIRKDLVKELEKLSEGHFTYELEWRLPEADTLVKIASSLSRLHQDYKFWFEDFKSHVSELLGSKSWDDASKEKHIKISENAFFTDETATTVSTVVDNNAGNKSVLLSVLSSTANPVTPTSRPLSHKLVYVATSASGNHVGGFCLWKLDKNVTDWSYFYDNIPVEYQSNHDSADHEQRATLAAVRVWAKRWEDAHVTLRSQHAAIERSDGVLRRILVDNLDRLSEGHFTYDLEWRLRKSDDLVKISFSLSRLNRNFGHWFAVFKASVDDILGAQNWNDATKSKRVLLNDEHFYTEETRPEINQASLQSTLAELEN